MLLNFLMPIVAEISPDSIALVALDVAILSDSVKRSNIAQVVDRVGRSITNACPGC